MSCSSDRIVTRGDTDTFVLTFTDSSGDPIDITGWTVWFTVREGIPTSSVSDDTEATISVKNTSHSDPTNGQTTIEITSDDTNISPKVYYYDIQYKKADGSIKSTGKYKYIVNSDITRGTS